MADEIFTKDENNNAAVRTVSVNAGEAETNSPVIFTKDENGNAAVRVVGAGGGGDIDYSKVIVKSNTIPVAGESYLGYEYQYMGETNGTYTHGYIYECVGSTTYASTESFEPATISGTIVTCSANAVATIASRWIHNDVTSIVSGTLTYDQGGNLWVFVGKDASDNTVGSFQLYQEDYEDAGFVFTGTPEDGDIVAFTCTITVDSVTYAWVRVDVQPTSKSLTVLLQSSDWSDSSQTVTAAGVTASNNVLVAPAPSSTSVYTSNGVMCTAQGTNSLTFSCTTTPSSNIFVNVVILP